MKRIRKHYGYALLLACGIALATTFGPFTIAETWANDSQAGNWRAANALAVNYRNSFLKDAKNGDSVRILYQDGYIVQFSVITMNSSVPLNLDKVVTSPNVLGNRDDSSATCHVGSSYTAYDTGYWGQNNYVDGAGVIHIVASWISTGTMFVLDPQHNACV